MASRSQHGLSPGRHQLQQGLEHRCAPPALRAPRSNPLTLSTNTHVRPRRPVRPPCGGRRMPVRLHHTLGTSTAGGGPSRHPAAAQALHPSPCRRASRCTAPLAIRRWSAYDVLDGECAVQALDLSTHVSYAPCCYRCPFWLRCQTSERANGSLPSRRSLPPSYVGSAGVVAPLRERGRHA